MRQLRRKYDEDIAELTLLKPMIYMYTTHNMEQLKHSMHDIV